MALSQGDKWYPTILRVICLYIKYIFGRNLVPSCSRPRPPGGLGGHLTYLNAENSKDYEERAADKDDVSDGL